MNSRDFGDPVLRVSYFLAASAVVGVGYYALYIFHHGELADKPYVVALQSVEYTGRSNHDANPLLAVNIDGAGTDAVGVPGRDAAATRVWVILNVADSDGDPFVLPQRIALKASCVQLERIVKGREVLPAVQQFLFGGCTVGT